jgi:hypothetical protein
MLLLNDFLNPAAYTHRSGNASQCPHGWSHPGEAQLTNWVCRDLLRDGRTDYRHGVVGLNVGLRGVSQGAARPNNNGIARDPRAMFSGI